MAESFPQNLKKFINDESSGGSPDAVKKALRATALGAGVILGASAAHLSPAEARGARIEIAEHVLSEAEVDFLVQNVYHEARGESLKGQLAVAQVTLARLLSGKFGKTLGDVVFAQNQFSWTKDPRILMTRMNDDTYENLKTTVTFITSGKRLREAVVALSKETELPANTYYYKRTDWDENNPNEKRMSRKTKVMFQNLKNPTIIDNQTFYTD